MSKVIVEVEHNGVARVTLNNPEKQNAFNDAIIRDLTNAFDGIACNPDVRLMILNSSGKNFSAGADLAWMKKMASYSHEKNLSDAKVLSEMFKTLHQMPQPTIVRIQGAAMGGALALIRFNYGLLTKSLFGRTPLFNHSLVIAQVRCNVGATISRDRDDSLAYTLQRSRWVHPTGDTGGPPGIVRHPDRERYNDGNRI